MQGPDSGTDSADGARAQWMRVLALADAEQLDKAFTALPHKPDYRLLRPAESGMVMVRARTGGTGAQFNLGEMSLSRCTVALSDNSVVGVAHVQGRNLRHAEQAAVLDALLQIPEWRERVQNQIIQPLANAHAASRDALAQAAASTKVEFFTLARGEE